MSTAATHNREKAFYEEHARQSLMDLFPGRFSSGIIISDKPDLQDLKNGIGVEVTRAMPQGAGEANGFFQKMRDKYLRDVDFRKIEKFKELGCELLIYKGKIEGYSPTAFWVSDKELIQAFTAKIKALNKSDFSCFRSNDLYIFSPLFKVYDLEDIDKFSKKAADIQLQFERKFDSIYINDFGYFFKCNLLDATSLQIPICDEQLHGYNVLAKKFIDGQSINE